MNNYYEVLGVTKESTQDEIKKAYREMAKKYHPDRGGDEVKFKEVSEAYETLSDENKRVQYDRFGTSGGQNGGSRYQSHGFEDIFADFGDIFGNGFGRQRQRVRKGSDLRVQLNVTLEDVMIGSLKKIKYKKQKSCNTCSGKGGTEIKSCIACNGTGSRKISQNTPFGNITQAIPCNNCEGTGQNIANKCKTCRGDGTVITEETIDINIPRGVAGGMNLSMPGYGNSIRDGVPGDLYIFINEIKHNKFNREGANLICEEWISIPEAVLGKNLTIPTLQGNVSIDIEPGCESGKVFTIKGKGVPNLANNGQVYGNGDLYIRVNVRIPKNVTDEQKEIYRSLL